MEMIKKIFIAILLIVLFSSYGFATDYYVRTDGTAANKGAATGPCSTQSATMNEAIHNGETFAAGDTIYICSENGGLDGQLSAQTDGTSGNYITYEGDGAGPHSDRTETAGVINLSSNGKDYIHWKDLVVKDGNTLLSITSSDYNKVTGCTLYNSRETNISISNSDYTTVGGSTTEGNTLYN